MMCRAIACFPQCFNTFGFIMKYPKQMSVNRLVANILSCVISLSIPIAAAGLTFIIVDQYVRAARRSRLPMPIPVAALPSCSSPRAAYPSRQHYNMCHRIS